MNNRITSFTDEEKIKFIELFNKIATEYTTDKWVASPCTDWDAYETFIATEDGNDFGFEHYLSITIYRKQRFWSKQFRYEISCYASGHSSISAKKTVSVHLGIEKNSELENTIKSIFNRIESDFVNKEKNTVSILDKLMKEGNHL
jgi:hypothetical protein